LLRMLQSARDSIARLGLDHLGELTATVDHVLRSMTADISSIGDRQVMLLTKTTRALAMAVTMDKSVAATVRGISAEIDEPGQRKSGALAGTEKQKALSNYL